MVGNFLKEKGSTREKEQKRSRGERKARLALGQKREDEQKLSLSWDLGILKGRKEKGFWFFWVGKKGVPRGTKEEKGVKKKCVLFCWCKAENLLVSWTFPCMVCITFKACS